VFACGGGLWGGLQGVGAKVRMAQQEKEVILGSKDCRRKRVCSPETANVTTL
jgi:hypothetical protein